MENRPKTLLEASENLNKELSNLFQLVTKELKIPQLVKWINKKLVLISAIRGKK